MRLINTNKFSLLLIAFITCAAVYLSLIITKSHLNDQYQRAYLALSDNIIQSRERLHYFNHQDNKAYDVYSSQLVSADLKATFLYERLENDQRHWLSRFLVSNHEAVHYAKNTQTGVSTLISNLETLLRLKVSYEYSTLTTLLLEEKLLSTLSALEDKLYVSQFTLTGLMDSPPNRSLEQQPEFKSLSNYIAFRERIKIESKNKEKDIFTNNVKQMLMQQNDYWLSQAESIKNHMFITVVLFICAIAAYFYLQLRERLRQTLVIKRDLFNSEKEKSKLALVAEHAHDAILITDKDGILTWANQSFCTLSGYQLNEVLGKKPGNILQGEKTSKDDINRISTAIKNGASIESELVNYHKNGTEYWIDIAITPTFDLEGSLEQFIAVERDITKRKALEIDLADAAKQAEVSNKAKSTFLATMSHELRTPLNGILGMAQIIESNIKDPEQHKQINVLLESGDHLLSLLNDILDFSKIEQNKLELNCEDFNFKDVINPITSTYIPICEDRGLNLIINNEIGPNTVFKGDKPRIRQIIFNLISNAVKFTHDGSITLLFNHTLTVKKETGITIQIKDSGIGIRQERLEKIFDPFIQAESSTTRQYGGTGLGLAIVKQLVDVMGGDISVNSTEGKGTTFTIVIPLETSIKQATVENKDHSPRTNIEETETPTNLSILIAEDNKVNALVAKMFCQRLGHQVTIAENGQIALDILQESSFDLIIMDNHMPIMDGITATQIIRNKLKLSTVIFACTADVFQEAHDNFIAAGANYILTKPLQEQSFLDAINHHKIKIERNKSSHQPKTNIIELKRYSKDKITTLALTEAELTLEPLIEICGDDIEIRNEFLTSFINTSEESITSLITAYDKKDIDNIRLHSHSIKGMAGNFDAHRLVESASSIEKDAKMGMLPKLNDIQQLINLLEVNIQQATRLMENKSDKKQGDVNINA